MRKQRLKTLEQVKLETIKGALKLHRSNVTHTAEALDVSLQTIRKYKKVAEKIARKRKRKKRKIKK